MDEPRGRGTRELFLLLPFVRQPVLLDVVAVGLEQRLGAAMLADLLLGPLDHPMALAGLREQHFSGAGDLEALFGARLGLQLGHLALLWPARMCGPRGPVRRRCARNERALELIRCRIVQLSRRHGSPKSAGRREAGVMAEGGGNGNWWAVCAEICDQPLPWPFRGHSALPLPRAGEGQIWQSRAYTKPLSTSPAEVGCFRLRPVIIG